MYRGLSIAVVMPAFNEERAILGTLRSVPDFVDLIVVVDDASCDTTAEVMRGQEASRPCEIIRHDRNQGVGAAIVTGYRRVLTLGLDVAVVMAGDGQMDPADLPALLDPIAAGESDYVKGNRFRHADIWRAMPKARLFGNALLSMATKVTSGYWSVFDSQCGYTAIHRDGLQSIELERVFARYGYPNDMLARLHTARMRVKDVPVRPIYGPNWRSGIGLHTVVYPISFVLMRSLVARVLRETGWWKRRALPQPSNADSV